MITFVFYLCFQKFYCRENFTVLTVASFLVRRNLISTATTAGKATWCIGTRSSLSSAITIMGIQAAFINI